MSVSRMLFSDSNRSTNTAASGLYESNSRRKVFFRSDDERKIATLCDVLTGISGAAADSVAAMQNAVYDCVDAVSKTGSPTHLADLVRKIESEVDHFNQAISSYQESLRVSEVSVVSGDKRVEHPVFANVSSPLRGSSLNYSIPADQVSNPTVEASLRQRISELEESLAREKENARIHFTKNLGTLAHSLRLEQAELEARAVAAESGLHEVAEGMARLRASTDEELRSLQAQHIAEIEALQREANATIARFREDRDNLAKLLLSSEAQSPPGISPSENRGENLDSAPTLNYPSSAVATTREGPASEALAQVEQQQEYQGHPADHAEEDQAMRALRAECDAMAAAVASVLGGAPAAPALLAGFTASRRPPLPPVQVEGSQNRSGLKANAGIRSGAEEGEELRRAESVVGTEASNPSTARMNRRRSSLGLDTLFDSLDSLGDSLSRRRTISEFPFQKTVSSEPFSPLSGSFSHSQPRTLQMVSPALPTPSPGEQTHPLVTTSAIDRANNAVLTSDSERQISSEQEKGEDEEVEPFAALEGLQPLLPSLQLPRPPILSGKGVSTSQWSFVVNQHLKSLVDAVQVALARERSELLRKLQTFEERTRRAAECSVKEHEEELKLRSELDAQVQVNFELRSSIMKLEEELAALRDANLFEQGAREELKKEQESDMRVIDEQRCQLESQLASFRHTLEERESELAAVQKELLSREEEIESLRNSTVEGTQELATMKESLLKCETRLFQTEQDKNLLEMHVNSLESTVERLSEERNHLILAANASTGTSSSELEVEAENSTRDSPGRSPALQAHIRTLSHDIELLQQRIEELGIEKATLQATIQVMQTEQTQMKLTFVDEKEKMQHTFVEEKVKMQQTYVEEKEKLEEDYIREKQRLEKEYLHEIEVLVKREEEAQQLVKELQTPLKSVRSTSNIPLSGTGRLGILGLFEDHARNYVSNENERKGGGNARTRDDSSSESDNESESDLVSRKTSRSSSTRSSENAGQMDDSSLVIERMAHEQLELQLQAVELEKSALVSKVAHLEEQLRLGREQLSDVSKEADESSVHSVEVLTLKEELESMREQNRSLINELEAFDALKTQSSSLNDTISSLTDTISSLKQQITSLEQEKAESERSKEVLQARIASLEAEVVERQQSLEVVELKRAALDAKLQESSVQLNSLRAELLSVRDSSTLHSEMMSKFALLSRSSILDVKTDESGAEEGESASMCALGIEKLVGILPGPVSSALAALLQRAEQLRQQAAARAAQELADTQEELIQESSRSLELGLKVTKLEAELGAARSNLSMATAASSSKEKALRVELERALSRATLLEGRIQEESERASRFSQRLSELRLRFLSIPRDIPAASSRPESVSQEYPHSTEGGMEEEVEEEVERVLQQLAALRQRAMRAETEAEAARAASARAEVDAAVARGMAGSPRAKDPLEARLAGAESALGASRLECRRLEAEVAASRQRIEELLSGSSTIASPSTRDEADTTSTIPSNHEEPTESSRKESPSSPSSQTLSNSRKPSAEGKSDVESSVRPTFGRISILEQELREANAKIARMSLQEREMHREWSENTRYAAQARAAFSQSEEANALLLARVAAFVRAETGLLVDAASLRARFGLESAESARRVLHSPSVDAISSTRNSPPSHPPGGLMSPPAAGMRPNLRFRQTAQHTRATATPSDVGEPGAEEVYSPEIMAARNGSPVRSLGYTDLSGYNSSHATEPAYFQTNGALARTSINEASPKAAAAAQRAHQNASVASLRALAAERTAVARHLDSFTSN